MQTSFAAVLPEHRARYPLMQPQDLAKLAYQSEYGPEHLLTDPDAAADAIRKEWRALPPNSMQRDPEDIGNGLCRFHLNTGCDPDLAAPLLAKLFALTAQAHRGTREGLLDKLQLLEPDPWLDAYQAQDCPTVHHSEIFRAAYAPHYRLLQTDYAGYFPALLRIAALLQRQERVTISIDGHCGSGKSGLADLIAALFDCNIFHTDDYYLPLDQRAPDWEQQIGGNMDLIRFRAEVLAPAFVGQPVQYRPYDCQTGRCGAAVTTAPRRLTVVEGSYSQHPALDVRYDLSLFLTCSSAEQTIRLKAREGDYFSMFKSRWIPMEERYINRCHIISDALILDTSNYF